MERRNQVDPEAIVHTREDPPSSSGPSNPTVVPRKPSCCERCQASFFGSLLFSPFYKNEISTLSLVHFISTLAIGISLSIAAEIDVVKHITKSNLYVFLIVYMWISIVWIIGAFCCGNKSGCCLAERQHDGYIPGYLIIGVTFLCIGSSFTTAVEFLPFVFSQACNFTNITNTVENELKNEAIFSCTKFIFLILQLYFFCRFSSKTFFDSCSMKIFLMHIIAVNLCTWFYIIVDESVDPKLKRPKYPTDRCPPFKAFLDVREVIDGFVYPFSIEYSVMSSVLLFLLWFRLKPREHQHNAPPSAETTQSTVKNEPHLQNTRWQRIKKICFDKCCSEGIPQGENKPASFWRSAICGYVFGVVVLIFILVIVTMLAVAFKVDQKDAVYVFQGSRIAIHSLMSFICLFGLKYLREYEPVAQTSHTIVDIALIMIGVSGCYLMVGFHITATGSDYSPCTHNETYPATQLSCKFLLVSLADYVCALIQFTLQAFFIVRALVRRCRSRVCPSKGRISSALVVRRCSAFLSIANIGMWAMDTFELKDISKAEVPEIRAYTQKTWLILSHVAFPLCIFFRLHSVFCCFEIVINRFDVILPEDKRPSYEIVSSEDDEIDQDALGVNS